MAAPSARPAATPAGPEAEQYQVVARRYRPQSFPELVGQAHVSSALTNAIQQNRVGHAYLFSGARGTGKTSSARILAKCLNCRTGPTVVPCQTCDSCQGITSGDDIDVLEIDGASNRRIEEIRQLRSNVNVRPSRARFKIYIIDEVHMLTKEAFNALLKTLEEPPDHVKFIFCTTELDKIPITIRSRCQLFEFVPVAEAAIRERLRQISQQESVEIDESALTLLARRAAGSMRDSQSLLEQLLVLGKARITLEDVNRFLGTADALLVQQMVEHLVDRRSSPALGAAQQAFRQGVDAGQLAGQLLGFFRDCLAASLGCDDDLLLHASPDQYSFVREVGGRIGPEHSLAIAQVLDDCLTKMRTSTYPQVVLELSLVRICRLEQLQALSDLIEQIRTSPGEAPTIAPPTMAPRAGSAVPNPSAPRENPPAAAAERSKKNEPPDGLTASASAQASTATVAEISAANVEAIWKQALQMLADSTADMAGQYQRLEWIPDGRIIATLSEQFERYCSLPERRSRVENMLAQVAGRPVRVEFKALAGEPSPAAAPVSRLKLVRDSARDPLVRAAIDVFDATITEVFPPKGPAGDAAVALRGRN